MASYGEEPPAKVREPRQEEVVGLTAVGWSWVRAKVLCC